MIGIEVKGFGAQALRKEERGWKRDACGDCRESDEEQAGLGVTGAKITE